MMDPIKAILGAGEIWISYATVSTVTKRADNAGLDIKVTLHPFGYVAVVRMGWEYAGNGFGLIIYPNTDDEVLVAFPAGILNQGVIIKRLSNLSELLPAAAADDRVLLIIEDGKHLDINLSGSGGVRLDIADDGNLDVTLEQGDINIEATQGDITIEAPAGSATFQANGTVRVEAGGNVEIVAGGNVDVDATGSATVDAVDVTVTAQNVTLTAAVTAAIQSVITTLGIGAFTSLVKQTFQAVYNTHHHNGGPNPPTQLMTPADVTTTVFGA